MFLYYSINSFLIFGVSSLKYSELKSLHPSCSPKDTCSDNIRSYITQILDSKFRNCYCDDFCQDYGDCCLDSKYYKEDEQIEHFKNYECVNIKSHGNVYMKRKCMNGWENKEIMQLCENSIINSHNGTISNQLHTPVISKYSAVTYTNYYCALCNNDAEDIMVWQTSLECPGLGDKLGKNSNFAYNSSMDVLFDNDKLGIIISQENNKEFHECSSVPSFPQNGESLLRKCWPALSTCLDEWSRTSMEKLCHSYTAITYSHNRTYKNLHCAICNNVDNTELHCRPPKSVSSKTMLGASSAKAFSILFDFWDLSGSNLVGTHCNEDEIWDSIFKKCRKIICKNVNHEYKHGKCVLIEGLKITTTKINDFQTLETRSDIAESIRNSFLPTTTQNSITHSIKVVIKNTDNDLPSFPEKEYTNHSIIAKIRPSNKANQDSQDNGNDQNTSQTNESIEIQGLTDNGNDQNTFQTNESIEIQGLNCNKILLSSAEFYTLNNNSIFVSKLKKTYYVDEYSKEGEDVLVCAEDFISFKFSYFMTVLTITGLVLSCFCLLLHLLTFFTMPHQRNLAGMNLASLSTTLLASYSIFIISMFSYSNANLCYTIAVLLYYAFLSSFFWMNIISFDIWFTLYNSKYFIVEEGKHNIRFLFYSIYSFGIPGLALLISLPLDFFEPSGFPKDYLPYFGKFVCWFGQRKSLLVFFGLPMIVLMAINMAYFIGSLHIIKSTQQLTVNIRTCSLYIDKFRLYASLTILSGLTWITGIIAGCIQIEVVWYIFILLNTLQGVFIFGLFTCRKIIWQSLMTCLFT